MDPLEEDSAIQNIFLWLSTENFSIFPYIESGTPLYVCNQDTLWMSQMCPLWEVSASVDDMLTGRCDLHFFAKCRALYKVHAYIIGQG